MKNALNHLATILISLFVATSCNKIETATSTDRNIITINYSIDDMIPVGDADYQTRISLDNTDKFIWAEGDTVGIYPNQGAQVFFVVEPNVSAGTAVFDGGGWSFRQDNTYSCYYPFIGDIYLNRTNIPVSFTGQKQTGISGIAHVGSHHYMYTDPTSAVNGMLNFGLHHLGCIIRPKLTLPAGTYTKLAITAPSNVFVKNGHYDLSSGTCAIVGDEFSNQIQIDLENITLTEKTTFRVYLSSAPVNLKGVELTVSVLDSKKKELQCKKTPSANYTAGTLAGLTCSTWTEVPQSMGMIIQDWENGGTIGGDAE